MNFVLKVLLNPGIVSYKKPGVDDTVLLKMTCLKSFSSDTAILY